MIKMPAFPLLEENKLMSKTDDELKAIDQEIADLRKLRKINAFKAWCEIYMPKMTEEEIEKQLESVSPALINHLID